MEESIEPENQKTEFHFVPDIQEEVMVTELGKGAKRTYRTPVEKHLFAKVLGSLLAMVALLIVPLVTLPGMIIPVLIAEVHLLDWTCSRFSLVRGSTSSTSSGSAEKSPEDEIDRRVARTGFRDKFIE